MNLDTTWILFGCVLLNAVAGLLLLTLDGERPSRASGPKETKRVKRAPRGPSGRAEDRLLEDLKRWRHVAESGEKLPLAADSCRVAEGHTLNRQVG